MPHNQYGDSTNRCEWCCNCCIVVGQFHKLILVLHLPIAVSASSFEHFISIYILPSFAESPHTDVQMCIFIQTINGMHTYVYKCIYLKIGTNTWIAFCAFVCACAHWLWKRWWWNAWMKFIEEKFIWLNANPKLKAFRCVRFFFHFEMFLWN